MPVQLNRAETRKANTLLRRIESTKEGQAVKYLIQVETLRAYHAVEKNFDKILSTQKEVEEMLARPLPDAELPPEDPSPNGTIHDKLPETTHPEHED